MTHFSCSRRGRETPLDRSRRSFVAIVETTFAELGRRPTGAGLVVTCGPLPFRKG